MGTSNSVDEIIKSMESAMYDIILERITTDKEVDDCYLINDVENCKLQIMYMEQAVQDGKLRGISLLNLMKSIDDADETEDSALLMPDAEAIHRFAESYRPEIEKLLASL